jgi:predicted TPR repeat methyltransferase
VVLAAMLTLGCATTRTTAGGKVGVEREQTMLLSSAEVNRAAAKAYQETLREAQARIFSTATCGKWLGCGRLLVG